MYLLITAAFALAIWFPGALPQQDATAGFVTVLGRDTIALETYRRNASHLEGDILLRAPRTVRYHYAIDLRADGGVSRSVVDFTQPGADNAPRHRATISFAGDSARLDIDSSDVQQMVKRAVPAGTVPELMSGFGSDYGLYISLGMYEWIIDHLTVHVNDTARVPVISAVGGVTGTKLIVRRSATLIDVDYFKIAWTHMAMTPNGLIEGADATETTEKTRSVRTGPFNIDSAAKEFVRRDRAGKAFGVSSPADSVHARLGPASIVINYSSPRKRGREILGTTVPFDHVWRTGANAATVLAIDRAVLIGGHSLEAGIYTLWTLPRRDGVELVINSQSGQWGTDYDPARDVVRLPMKVTRAPSAQENFTITVAAHGGEGELQIRWDDFAWTIPISVR